MYLIDYVIVETLTTGRMTPSWNNSPSAEAVIVKKNVDIPSNVLRNVIFTSYFCSTFF